MTINAHEVSLVLDTGADFTLISRSIWRLLGNPKLQQANVKPTQADGSSLELLGSFACDVNMNGKKFTGKCYVTENCALLGLDWIKHDEALYEALT